MNQTPASLNSDIMRTEPLQNRDSPWYVFMVVQRKNETMGDIIQNLNAQKDAEDICNSLSALIEVAQKYKEVEEEGRSLKTQPCAAQESHSKKHRSSGDHISLVISQTPLRYVQSINEHGGGKDFKHKRRCPRPEDVSASSSSSSSNTLSCQKLSYVGSQQPLKRQTRRRHSSKIFKLGVVVGPFSTQTTATSFMTLWDRKSRGSIPRSAWGVALSAHFGKEVFADPNVIFAEDIFLQIDENGPISSSSPSLPSSPPLFFADSHYHLS